MGEAEGGFVGEVAGGDGVGGEVADYEGDGCGRMVRSGWGGRVWRVDEGRRGGVHQRMGELEGGIAGAYAVAVATATTTAVAMIVVARAIFYPAFL